MTETPPVDAGSRRSARIANRVCHDDVPDIDEVLDGANKRNQERESTMNKLRKGRQKPPSSAKAPNQEKTMVNRPRNDAMMKPPRTSRNSTEAKRPAKQAPNKGRNKENCSASEGSDTESEQDRPSVPTVVLPKAKYQNLIDAYNGEKRQVKELTELVTDLEGDIAELQQSSCSEDNVERMNQHIDGLKAQLEKKDAVIKELKQKNKILQAGNKGKSTKHEQKADITKEVVKWVKGNLFRNVKFIVKDSVLEAKTRASYAYVDGRCDLKEGEKMSEDEYVRIYKECVKSTLSSLRQYIQSRGNDKARGGYFLPQYCRPCTSSLTHFPCSKPSTTSTNFCPM